MRCTLELDEDETFQREFFVYFLACPTNSEALSIAGRECTRGT